jgi:hypothetical protein
VQKPEYTISLEYNEEYIALHLPHVEKFTKTAYLDFLSTVDELKEFSETFGKTQLFVGIPTGDVKMGKFATKAGFEFLGEGEGEIDVYVYKLEENN